MAAGTNAENENGNIRIKEGVILGLGNPMIDLIIHADENTLSRYGLNSNDAIIATERHQELLQELEQNPGTVRIPGGSCLNSVRVAQWILQRPKATIFFGGVGEDDSRRILEEAGKEVGVQIRFQVHENCKTGVCAAIITGGGRSLVTDLGAAKHFTEQFLHHDENWSHVEQAQVFYIAGFVLPVAGDSIRTIADHSNKSGKTLAMNLSAMCLAEHFVDPDFGIMQFIDILFGNGDEAVEFSRQAGFDTTDIKEIALKTAALPKRNANKSRIVILTQGELPVILAHGGNVEEFRVEPMEPSLIKDTNGCGDAFVGGFLSQFVQGMPLGECVNCGLYAAREILQNIGCTFQGRSSYD